MIEKQVQIGKHYLYPSNLFVSDKPYQITTVLGSCIAVCLFETEKLIGGMNHFMLPFWNGEGLASAKYGNIAIERLINEMRLKGAKLEKLQAKMFGGANQVNLSLNIGDRNIALARKVLAEEGIPIVAESVGGTKGRKLIFDTYTGLVHMKYIQQTQILKHKI
ncbi:MAG: chemotaxis protein CheD [Bacteroidota bacterium]